MTTTDSSPAVPENHQDRHPGDSLTRRQRLAYVLVLGVLTALGPLTVDLYLPALPLLQQDFHASVASAQFTLGGTALGFGLGQLVAGPWSDKVGRRLPLILATALHLLASFGAATAADITILSTFRVLQGFGAAAGGVAAVAICRDLFGGKSMVRMLSRLALVSGVAPVLAPVIGSELLRTTDWRGLFWFLAGFGGLVLLAVTLLVRETLPAKQVGANRSGLRVTYAALFHDHVYVGALLIGAMLYAGLFAYLSSSSFLFQDVYHLTAQQFGLIFAVNSVGVITGIQISSKLMRGALHPQWALAGSTVVIFAAAVAIYVDELAGLGFWGTVIPLWIFVAGLGFANPAAQVLALAQHRNEAGTAASLLGATNSILAGLLVPLLGLFGVHNAQAMALVMICTSATAIAALWWIVRPRTVPALER